MLERRDFIVTATKFHPIHGRSVGVETFIIEDVVDVAEAIKDAQQRFTDRKGIPSQQVLDVEELHSV